MLIGPDLDEDTLEVSTENPLDVLVAVTASDQSFGKIEHSLGMVNPLNVAFSDRLAEPPLLAAGNDGVSGA